MSTIDYNMFAFLLGKFVKGKEELIIGNKEGFTGVETSMFNMKDLSKHRVSPALEEILNLN